MVKMKKGIIFLLIIAFSSCTKATTPEITVVTTFFTFAQTIAARTVSFSTTMTALSTENKKKSPSQLLLTQKQLVEQIENEQSLLQELLKKQNPAPHQQLQQLLEQLQQNHSHFEERLQRQQEFSKKLEHQYGCENIQQLLHKQQIILQQLQYHQPFLNQLQHQQRVILQKLLQRQQTVQSLL
uniref:Glutamine/leucine-rich protein n=1 Tax=Brugia malayi TaxID=6279 RepID=D5LG69_BRUMA|nr:glutamine/leucine-rich protein precursor [Brugia malayi]